MDAISILTNELKSQRPFFNYEKAVLTEQKYVAWVDLMGAGSVLAISDFQAAIFIGKLHGAILRARRQVKFVGSAYPLVDGCYITSSDRSSIQALLKAIFKLVALSFIFEQVPEHRYMPRAALSFGQVIEAKNIIECAPEFREKVNSSYVDGILFGTPLALAYQSEKFAAPFGVWVEQNARHFCPPNGKTIRTTFWEWWSYPSSVEEVDSHCDEIEKILAAKLAEHLTWSFQHSHKILYPNEKISIHREIASQYFPSWPKS
jgi:hypothetical protein